MAKQMSKAEVSAMAKAMNAKVQAETAPQVPNKPNTGKQAVQTPKNAVKGQPDHKMPVKGNSGKPASQPAQAPKTDKPNGKPADKAPAAKPTVQAPAKPANKPKTDADKVGAMPKAPNKVDDASKAVSAKPAERPMKWGELHSAVAVELDTEPETMDEAIREVRYANKLLGQVADVLYSMIVLAELKHGMTKDELVAVIQTTCMEVRKAELVEEQVQEFLEWQAKAEDAKNAYKAYRAELDEKAKAAEAAAAERIGKANAKTAKVEKADKAIERAEKAVSKAKGKQAEKQAEKTPAKPASKPNKPTGKPTDKVQVGKSARNANVAPPLKAGDKKLPQPANASK